MPEFMYCKMDGIEGDVKRPSKYQGAVTILAIHHSVSMPADWHPGARGDWQTGQSSHAEFVISKTMDKSSPKIMEYVSKGKKVDKIEIWLCAQRDAKAFEYITYTFDHCILTSYVPSGG